MPEADERNEVKEKEGNKKNKNIIVKFRENIFYAVWFITSMKRTIIVSRKKSTKFDYTANN